MIAQSAHRMCSGLYRIAHRMPQKRPTAKLVASPVMIIEPVNLLRPKFNFTQNVATNWKVVYMVIKENEHLTKAHLNIKLINFHTQIDSYHFGCTKNRCHNTAEQHYLNDIASGFAVLQLWMRIEFVDFFLIFHLFDL